MTSNTNIISVEERNDEVGKVGKVDKVVKVVNEIKKSTIRNIMGNNYINTKIFITIIVIFMVMLLIYFMVKNNQEPYKNNSKKKKKSKKNKKDDDDSESESDSEGYKTQQTRDDPYDEYDVETEIKKLLQKQEKYLEKINTYSDY